MIRTHVLGFPRIGAQRELKFAPEQYWRGEMDATELKDIARELRRRCWAMQSRAGLDYVTVGDFALYDHVLNHIQMFGCEPKRFGFTDRDSELPRYFTMARGVAINNGIPTVDEMERLLRKAAVVIPPDNLWVNPDCGLKTRGWEETEIALRNMVEAARRIRGLHL